MEQVLVSRKLTPKFQETCSLLVACCNSFFCSLFYYFSCNPFLLLAFSWAFSFTPQGQNPLFLPPDDSTWLILLNRHCTQLRIKKMDSPTQLVTLLTGIMGTYITSTWPGGFLALTVTLEYTQITSFLSCCLNRACFLLYSWWSLDWAGLLLE